MASTSYEVLKTAKSALDEGLINQADYDDIKNSFLRAQQIKAGLDAGFIKEAEFTNVKRAFLNSLNLQGTPEKPQPAAGPSDGDSAGPKGPSWPPGPVPPRPAGRASSTAAEAGPRQPPPATERAQPAAPVPRPAPVPVSAPAQPQPRAGPQARTASTPHAAAAREEPQPRSNVPRNIPNAGGRRPKQNAGTSISGISISEDAINMYYLLKANAKYRWTTWMINSAGNEVVIADVGESTSGYEGFLGSLPAADCRYGVYDYQFTNSEGCVFNKIAFVNWAPDAAKVKAKMMYASTKDYLKGFLDGLAVELQASDIGEIQETDLSEAVRSTITRQ